MTKKELKEALLITGDTTITHNGKKYTIVVDIDLDPVNPRKYGSIGSISYHHSRYRLGEEYIKGEEDFYINRLRDMGNSTLLVRYDDSLDLNDADYDKLMQEIKTLVLDNFYVCDLYMHDHSTIALSLSPFNCRFDSGQLGYIWESKEAIKQNFDDITEDEVRKIFKAIIEEYTDYINGLVFYCNITSGDEFVESCGNLIGEDTVLDFVSDIVGIQE